MIETVFVDVWLGCAFVRVLNGRETCVITVAGRLPPRQLAIRSPGPEFQICCFTTEL